MNDDLFLDFKCPLCQEDTSFPGEFAGQVQDCPNCLEPIIIPADGSPVGKPIPLPVLTERLVLRRLNEDDADALGDFVGDESLYTFTESRAINHEEIVHWLALDAKIKPTTPNRLFCLGLEDRNSRRLIGYLSMSFTSPQILQAVLAFIVIRADRQKAGLGVEAVRALQKFCLQGLALHRLAAHCDSRNTAAVRLLTKAGFRREGEFAQDRFVDGEWTTTLWFARLGSEGPA